MLILTHLMKMYFKHTGANCFYQEMLLIGHEKSGILRKPAVLICPSRILSSLIKLFTTRLFLFGINA